MMKRQEGGRKGCHLFVLPFKITHLSKKQARGKRQEARGKRQEARGGEEEAGEAGEGGRNRGAQGVKHPQAQGPQPLRDCFDADSLGRPACL